MVCIARQRTLNSSGAVLTQFGPWVNAGPTTTTQVRTHDGAHARRGLRCSCGRGLGRRGEPRRPYRQDPRRQDGGAPTWTVDEPDSLTTRQLRGVWATESEVWIVGENGSSGALRRRERRFVQISSKPLPRGSLRRVRVRLKRHLGRRRGGHDPPLGRDELDEDCDAARRAVDRPRLLSVWGGSRRKTSGSPEPGSCCISRGRSHEHPQLRDPGRCGRRPGLHGSGRLRDERRGGEETSSSSSSPTQSPLPLCPKRRLPRRTRRPTHLPTAGSTASSPARAAQVASATSGCRSRRRSRASGIRGGRRLGCRRRRDPSLPRQAVGPGLRVLRDHARQHQFCGDWGDHSENVWAVANADTNRVVLVRYTKPDGGAPRFSETVTTVALNASTLPSIWVTPASDTVWLTNGTGAVSRYRDDGNGGVVSETLTPTARPGGHDEVLLELRLSWGQTMSTWPARITTSCPGRGARRPIPIAHFDGSDWTITEVPSPVVKTAGLYGTPPVGPQRLWHAKNPSVLTVSLFPIEDGGIERRAPRPRRRLRRPFAWGSSAGRRRRRRGCRTAPSSAAGTVRSSSTSRRRSAACPPAPFAASGRRTTTTCGSSVNPFLRGPAFRRPGSRRTARRTLEARRSDEDRTESSIGATASTLAALACTSAVVESASPDDAPDAGTDA